MNESKEKSIAKIISLWENNPLKFKKKAYLVYKSPYKEAYKISYQKKSFFLKILKSNYTNNKRLKFIFSSEKKGLKILKKVSDFEINKVHFYRDPCNQKQAFVLSDWKDLSRLQIKKSKKLFFKVAYKLSKMHKQSLIEKDIYYGLDFNNYIGVFLQNNTKERNWIYFFSNNRIQPLLSILKAKKRWNLNFEKKWDLFLDRIKNILNPQEKPCLVHGDFWIGNVFYIEKNENILLIDPAIHYAPCEWDIASALYWGGFSESFFEDYKNLNPLSSGYQERIRVYQIYYHLIYLILERNKPWDFLQKKMEEKLSSIIENI